MSSPRLKLDSTHFPHLSNILLALILYNKFIFFKTPQKTLIYFSYFVSEVEAGTDCLSWLNVWAVKNNPDTTRKWATGSRWHTVAKHYEINQLWPLGIKLLLKIKFGIPHNCFNSSLGKIRNANTFSLVFWLHRRISRKKWQAQGFTILSEDKIKVASVTAPEKLLSPPVLQV